LIRERENEESLPRNNWSPGRLQIGSFWEIDFITYSKKVEVGLEGLI
jgi:hypothetical protein